MPLYYGGEKENHCPDSGCWFKSIEQDIRHSDSHGSPWLFLFAGAYIARRQYRRVNYFKGVIDLRSHMNASQTDFIRDHNLALFHFRETAKTVVRKRITRIVRNGAQVGQNFSGELFPSWKPFLKIRKSNFFPSWSQVEGNERRQKCRFTERRRTRTTRS